MDLDGSGTSPRLPRRLFGQQAGCRSHASVSRRWEESGSEIEGVAAGGRLAHKFRDFQKLSEARRPDQNMFWNTVAMDRYTSNPIPEISQLVQDVSHYAITTLVFAMLFVW